MVRQVLHGPTRGGEVLAVFQHTCDLLTDDGEVVAIVAPGIGDGPLNVVLRDDDDPFRGLHRGASARLERRRLLVGPLEVGLQRAVVWNPRPDWGCLRRRASGSPLDLIALRRLATEQAVTAGFLRLLGTTAPRTESDPTRSAAQRGLDELRKGWSGDLHALHRGAKAMAGLGGGLTPSGDDLLAGLMLWGHLAHPRPHWLCQALLEAAVDRTTTLSAAFLRSAARGECPAAWHELLAGLVAGEFGGLSRAVSRVLAHGATSGADTLAGFLSMGAP